MEEKGNLRPGRDKGQIGAEFAEGDLSGIPGLMKDIEPEKLEMGNDHVHGTVRKLPGSLEPMKEAANHVPGDMGRGNPELLKVGKIRLEIRLVAPNRVRGKILCLKHFNKNR